MTLPKDGKKLTETELKSIENAIKDTGIKAVHPEKMEALAEMLVSKLKNEKTQFTTLPISQKKKNNKNYHSLFSNFTQKYHINTHH